ncbi:unnamed protein product [Rotaria sp. Silwood2]|nr:unnamed protein product [Rotaria sp. Silwood2]
MTNLYDTSLDGLIATRSEVNSLQLRHAWYHSNLTQIKGLKEDINKIQERYDSNIQNILDQIAKQKVCAKEILVNSLNQLESTINTQDIRKYLNELINAIDHLLGPLSEQVLLISIFSGLGLLSFIAAFIALFAGASAFGVATLGLGFLVSSTASEVMFRSKLSELDENLSDNIRNVQNQKYERIKKLDEYFNNFEQRLQHCHTHDHNSKINIVWYDKNLQSHENQCYIERLRNEFSAEQYQIMQFDDKDQSIDSVVSSITNNLILITSGSAGEEVISEIGYYFHIKAIKSSIDYHNMTMTKLHNELKKKRIYPKDIPSHFQLENLLKCAQQFVEALKKPEPEKNIIHLYTTEAPYYYKIINDILNLLDEDLIVIIQDYVKALRYSLITYEDASNKMPATNNVKLYRGISLAQDNSFAEFSRKFKIHDTIIFPAFSSTSLNKDRTRSFIKGKGVLLEISADCSKLNKPKNISAQSEYPSEDEVLLNCFSILKVENITTMNDDLLCYKCTLELR